MCYGGRVWLKKMFFGVFAAKKFVYACVIHIIFRTFALAYLKPV